MMRALVAIAWVTLSLWPLASLAAEPREQILGTWLLVRVELPLMESAPGGIPVVKEHYAADGRMYFIPADQAMSDKTDWATYKIEGKKRTVKLAGEGEAYTATVDFPDINTLLVTQSSGEQWRYIRMQGGDAKDRKLAPDSVEFLKTSDSPAAPDYDTQDYSSRSPAERVLGRWEAVINRVTSKRDLPPYGFFNDVWVFEADEMWIAARPKEQRSKGVPYRIVGKRIEASMPDGETQRFELAFDSWGRMLLTLEGHTIVLKRIDAGTSREAPLPPLRITLVELAGEVSR